MASTISAGTTTTTALSYSADISGVLQLQTNGGTTALTLDTSQNATFAGKVASASSLQLATNGTTTAVTIDTAQNVGIGTSSPLTKLHAMSSGASATFALSPNNSNTNIAYVTNDATYVSLGSSVGSTGVKFRVALGAPDNAATIDSSGNLLVGTTSVSSLGTATGFVFSPNFQSVSGNGTLYIGNSASTNTQAGINLYSTGAGAYRFYVDMAGIVHATSTTISSISDIRFKENVRDLNVGLAEVMALKPRLYDWKEGKGADIKNARGFIAQEFETVFPDLIDEWKDPAPEGEEPYKSVRADLIPVLVKAIQELSAQVTTLQTQVTALKG